MGRVTKKPKKTQGGGNRCEVSSVLEELKSVAAKGGEGKGSASQPEMEA